MAGTYPDPPSWRMGYDRDGTQGFTVASGSATALTELQMQRLNDETIGNELSAASIVFIFPELRDILGFYTVQWTLDHGRATSVNVSVSSDTTNGVDGTWTQVVAPYTAPLPGALKPGYRTDIKTVTGALGVKAVRMNQSGNWGPRVEVIHLYGNRAAATDRLELWKADVAERIDPGHLDWGDAPRLSSATRSFRVKNLSASKTATLVQITAEAPSDSSPSMLSQYEFSVDGGATWATSTALPDIAPGGVSSEVVMRRTTTSDSALSVWAFRVAVDTTMV